MLFLVKLTPEFSRKVFEEAEGTLTLSLGLLHAKKKTIIVSFRQHSSV